MIDTVNILVASIFIATILCAVPIHTTSVLARGELGRYPLCLAYFIRCIKYWLKLTRMENFRYPKQSYLMLKNLDDRNRITWATSIRNLLCRYGFGYVWIAQEVGDIDNFNQIFKKIVKDNSLQEWYSDINETSKAYHYKIFKCIFESENYLSLDIPAKYIHTFSKFRCSSHKLFVETGRHRDIPYHHRICSLCTLNQIEDEFHFMCICPLYSDVRERYFPNKYIS